MTLDLARCALARRGFRPVTIGRDKIHICTRRDGGMSARGGPQQGGIGNPYK